MLAIELNHLREFIVLAHKGNFLEAAESLFISQSTLSKHIKSIELELGASLFNRTTRKVELSQYGQMLLPYAKQIVQLQKDFTKELLTSLEKNQNCLEIGSIPALPQYNITNLLVQLKRECRNLTMHIHQAGTEQLKDWLRDDTCELAFLRETEIKRDEFVRLPYDTDTLVAVLPIAHPWAGRKTIPVADLKNEELLFIEKQTMLYDLCCKACRQSGFEPNIVFTDHKLDHLVDFVQKGMGIALLMKQLALYLQNPNVAVIELTPRVSTQISLCYKKDVALSAAAKHLLEITRHTIINRPQ